jgi:hypothetical protein
VVPRPVAHAPAGLGGRVIAAWLLVLLLAAGAEALDIDVVRYRQAAQTGDVGTVTGRAYAESRTPSGPVRPLAGVTVTLLPRSPALLASFERLKEDARSSSKAFAAAAPAMRRAQEIYERELVKAGVPDLAPRVAVTPEGAFRLEEVPAGAWVVVAWQSLPVDITAAKARGRERNLYQLEGRLTGFRAVTIWLREVGVARGETASVELTDRNEWFRGVIEEKALDAGH